MATDAQIRIVGSADFQRAISETRKFEEQIKAVARANGVTKGTAKRLVRQIERQEKASKRAGKETGRLRKRLGGMANAVGNAVPQVGALQSQLATMGAAGGPVALAAGAIAALAAGAVVAANRMSEFVDQQNRLSQSTGLTVHQVLALRDAVESAGGEFGSAESGLGEFVRRAQDARQKGGEAAQAFDRYGISLETMNGELRPAGDLLRDTLRALDNIEDPTARAAARTQLFGAEAGKSLGVLTGASMDQAIANTESLAASTAAAQSSSAAMDESTTRLNRSLSEAMVRLGDEVTPAVVTLADATSDVLEVWNEWGGTLRTVGMLLSGALGWLQLAAEAMGAFGETSAISERDLKRLEIQAESTARSFDTLSAAATGRRAEDSFTPGVKKQTRRTSRRGPDPEAERRKARIESEGDLLRDFADERETERQRQIAHGQAIQDQMDAELERHRMLAEQKEAANQREIQAMQTIRALHTEIGMAAVDAAGAVVGAAGGQKAAIFAQIAQAIAYQAVAAARAAAEGGLIAGIPAALGMVATLAPFIGQAVSAANQFDMGGQVAAGSSQPDQAFARVRAGEVILAPNEADQMERRQRQPAQLVIDHRGYDAMTRSSGRQSALFPRRRHAEAT